MNDKMTYVTWKDAENHIYPTGESFATIYFHGFLAMCFDGDKQCEIGVDSLAISHNLNVQIRERGTPECNKITLTLPDEFDDITKTHTMNINVSNPKEGGVYVCTPDPPYKDTKGRYSYTHYSFDMESNEMHGQPVKRKPQYIWPRFHINNGLFYTYKLSKSEFKLWRDRDLRREGVIGLVLATDIYLNDGGTLEFKCDCDTTSRLTLFKNSNKKYEIAISNSCRTTPEPVSRTDFYLYYEDIIDKSDPGLGQRFELNLKTKGGTHDPVVYGPCEMTDFSFSDPAPCLPVTFGRSTTLG